MGNGAFDPNEQGIYCSPQKMSGIQGTQKVFESYQPPKNIPILYIDLKKKPFKCIEMTTKK